MQGIDAVQLIATNLSIKQNKTSVVNNTTTPETEGALLNWSALDSDSLGMELTAADAFQILKELDDRRLLGRHDRRRDRLGLQEVDHLLAPVDPVHLLLRHTHLSAVLLQQLQDDVNASRDGGRAPINQEPHRLWD